VTAASRWLVCVAVVLAAAAHASDQSVQLQYSGPTATLESPPGETVRELFSAAFDRRINEQFADQFHPFNQMTSIRESVALEAS